LYIFQDNIDQVFHAKIFLNGHLTVPSHQYKEFFDFTHNINNGKWYSEYPPGHTFTLMLGLLLGAPWIVNPLLGSLSIVLFYLIGREVFDEKIGVYRHFWA
jgi:asparagine N-glycosylation enzyme membrane subunit Stt3